MEVAKVENHSLEDAAHKIQYFVTDCYMHQVSLMKLILDLTHKWYHGIIKL